MITGSTAVGEAIPWHFQFSMASKSKDTQRLNVTSITYFPKIKGKFGNSDFKEWPVTIGMNEKGGMDDVEFRQYFLNSIVPLFPDSDNVNGKRVMVKVDCRPGRLQDNFLAKVRTLGFVIYYCLKPLSPSSHHDGNLVTKWSCISKNKSIQTKPSSSFISGGVAVRAMASEWSSKT